MTYGDYDYPKWAEVMGLCISFSSMIWIVIYAIYYLATTPGTLGQRWSTGVTPLIDQALKNGGAASEVEPLNPELDEVKGEQEMVNLA